MHGVAGIAAGRHCQGHSGSTCGHQHRDHRDQRRRRPFGHTRWSPSRRARRRRRHLLGRLRADAIRGSCGAGRRCRRQGCPAAATEPAVSWIHVLASRTCNAQRGWRHSRAAGPAELGARFERGTAVGTDGAGHRCTRVLTMRPSARDRRGRRCSLLLARWSCGSRRTAGRWRPE